MPYPRTCGRTPGESRGFTACTLRWGFRNKPGSVTRWGQSVIRKLGTLREATVDRPALTPPAWKLALRAVGESVALEFRLGPEIAGLLQPGGKIGEYTLVYVGDHWALMAAPDQLFAVPF